MNARCPRCSAPGLTAEPCSGASCQAHGAHLVPAEYLSEGTTHDERTGQCIEDYLLVRLLGRGSFGKVYVALRLPVLRPVAIKLLMVDAASDQVLDSRQRFEDEARTLARLSHPNIVAIHRYGTDGGYPYIAMDFVEGGREMRHDVRQWKARTEDAVPAPLAGIIHQVLSALDAAHAQQIVHRDIKPDNIMLQRGPEGLDRVRVLDFGLAKFVAQATRTHSITGTPMYMAPEQVQMRHIGPWTDLFALAMICYEIILKRSPYQGMDMHAILRTKFQADERLLQDVPPAYAPFFERALAFDYQQRFDSAQAFRAAFDEMLGLRASFTPTRSATEPDGRAAAEPDGGRPNGQALDRPAENRERKSDGQRLDRPTDSRERKPDGQALDHPEGKRAASGARATQDHGVKRPFVRLTLIGAATAALVCSIVLALWWAKSRKAHRPPRKIASPTSVVQILSKEKPRLKPKVDHKHLPKGLAPRTGNRGPARVKHFVPRKPPEKPRMGVTPTLRRNTTPQPGTTVAIPLVRFLPTSSPKYCSHLCAIQRKCVIALGLGSNHPSSKHCPLVCRSVVHSPTSGANFLEISVKRMCYGARLKAKRDAKPTAK